MRRPDTNRYEIIILGWFALLGAPSAGAVDCPVKIAPEGIRVSWMAFKTTAKVPVSGAYRSVRIAAPADRATSFPASLIGTTADIDAIDVSTGSALKDSNLKRSFFMRFVSPTIHGEVTRASGNARQGSLTVTLTMNGFRVPMLLPYSVDDRGLLSGKATLSLADFALLDALAELDRTCEAFHTGDDGVTKTWPVVDVTVEAQVMPIQCNSG